MPAFTSLDTNQLSIAPNGRDNYQVVCEYFVNRDYGKCQFISAVRYKVGETFDMKVNPKNLSETTMTPPKAWKAWVGIGFMILWLVAWWLGPLLSRGHQ